MELRSPDPACNPYLAFALLLHAGLDGIERGLPLCGATNRNLLPCGKGGGRSSGSPAGQSGRGGRAGGEKRVRPFNTAPKDARDLFGRQTQGMRGHAEAPDKHRFEEAFTFHIFNAHPMIGKKAVMMWRTFWWFRVPGRAAVSSFSF